MSWTFALKNHPEDRYGLGAAPYILFHVAAVAGVFLVPFAWKWVALAIGYYYLRMFGITAGYHRYFAHRGYKTNRVFQFILALIGTAAVQKGVLWWAAHHRDHHKYSDQPEDVHSPRQRGLFYAHTGWILSKRWDKTRYERIKDFAKYPEIVWLNEHWLLVNTIQGVLMWALFGWSALVWVFFVSTTVLWHGTFTINSLCHVFGRRRYQTTDDSKNSLLLALITMGEGWHNNHHYYQSTARQGFFWWEIDMSYAILKALSFFRIVWDLRQPPAWVLRNEPPPHKHKKAEGESELEEGSTTEALAA
ncbi:MAG: acyl-CoA desaturase [Myxococcota bacterium]